MRWRSSLYFSWSSFMYGWRACISRIPCIDLRVNGRTISRDNQVSRTIAIPQARPMSSCIQVITELKASLSCSMRGRAAIRTLRFLRWIGAGGTAGRWEDWNLRSLGASGSVTEEAPIGELVNAAVAERVAAEQPPAGQDRAADRAQLADRLHGVGGAGGVVAAARAEGRRDEALIEADRGDQDGGRQPFHDKRSSSGASTSSARQARTPSCPSRSSSPSTPGR